MNSGDEFQQLVAYAKDGGRREDGTGNDRLKRVLGNLRSCGGMAVIPAVPCTREETKRRHDVIRNVLSTSSASLLELWNEVGKYIQSMIAKYSMTPDVPVTIEQVHTDLMIVDPISRVASCERPPRFFTYKDVAEYLTLVKNAVVKATSAMGSMVLDAIKSYNQYSTNGAMTASAMSGVELLASNMTPEMVAVLELYNRLGKGSANYATEENVNLMTMTSMERSMREFVMKSFQIPECPGPIETLNVRVWEASFQWIADQYTPTSPQGMMSTSLNGTNGDPYNSTFANAQNLMLTNSATMSFSITGPTCAYGLSSTEMPAYSENYTTPITFEEGGKFWFNNVAANASELDVAYNGKLIQPGQTNLMNYTAKGSSTPVAACLSMSPASAGCSGATSALVEFVKGGVYLPSSSSWASPVCERYRLQTTLTVSPTIPQDPQVVLIVIKFSVKPAPSMLTSSNPGVIMSKRVVKPIRPFNMDTDTTNLVFDIDEELGIGAGACQGIAIMYWSTTTLYANVSTYTSNNLGDGGANPVATNCSTLIKADKTSMNNLNNCGSYSLHSGTNWVERSSLKPMGYYASQISSPFAQLSTNMLLIPAQAVNFINQFKNEISIAQYIALGLGYVLPNSTPSAVMNWMMSATPNDLHMVAECAGIFVAAGVVPRQALRVYAPMKNF